MRLARFRIRARRFVRHTLVPMGVTVLVLCSFRSAIADWNIVPSGSMNPSIVEGDRIFVNKLAYGLKVPFTTWHLAHWDQPQRGEIVVFRSPVDGTRYVKRVVGLPGDTIQMIDNRLLINGVAARYESVGSPSRGRILASEVIAGESHPVMATPALPARRNFGPIAVPLDQFFVLGDNRDNSADSRFIGFIPRDNILGRSSAVVLSLDPNNYWPKWERTLMALP
jgi:signal peptidase I